MPLTDNEHALSEIRQLERDLENLERCYSALQRSARRVKATFFVFIAALVTLVLCGLAIGSIGLAAMSFLSLIVSATMAMYAYSRGGRWIDVVGWSPREGMIKRTEAMAVEDMIADRKARLAALGADQWRSR